MQPEHAATNRLRQPAPVIRRSQTKSSTVLIACSSTLVK